MKNFSKKIKLLVLSIATIYSFSSISYAKETTKIQERKISLYKLNEEEQASLFKFLQGRLYLTTVASLLEANDACDYCQQRNSLSLTYPEGFPDYLQELGFSENDSPNSNKNCNLCQVLEKLPFKELYKIIHTKLIDLQKAEYYIFSEKVAKFPEEVEELLYGFEMDSLDELEAINGFYEELYDRLEKNGWFPNLLDKIGILKAVSEDLLELIEKVEKRENFGQLALTLAFAKDLAAYKKFLNNQMYDISFQLQNIGGIGFIPDEGPTLTLNLKDLL